MTEPFDEALVEAMARAIYEADHDYVEDDPRTFWRSSEKGDHVWVEFVYLARAALAVAVPVLREREWERCAQIAVDCLAAFLEGSERPVKYAVGRHIAATIRAQGEGWR